MFVPPMTVTDQNPRLIGSLTSSDIMENVGYHNPVKTLDT